MTAPSEDVSEQLLVSIDLGGSPSLRNLYEQHGYLLDLWRYSFMAAEVGVFLHPSDRPVAARSGAPNRMWDTAFPREVGQARREAVAATAFRVTRSSLSRPWTTILEMAGKGAPLAYVAGGAYGTMHVLRELLSLKMNWDRHRGEIGRQKIDIDRMRREEVEQLLSQHKRLVGSENPLAPPAQSSGVAEEALAKLGFVAEVRLLASGSDPARTKRAGGGKES